MVSVRHHGTKRLALRPRTAKTTRSDPGPAGRYDVPPGDDLTVGAMLAQTGVILTAVIGAAIAILRMLG